MGRAGPQPPGSVLTDTTTKGATAEGVGAADRPGNHPGGGAVVTVEAIRTDAHGRHEGTAPPGRITWLDSAKGIGIILVVIGHALGGLIDSALGTRVPGFREAFFAIYTFHMPLFFLLSGVLVAPRLARDRKGFERSLWTNIAWPYFLWSAVQFTLISSLGSIVNQPVQNYWSTLLSLPWKTVSQFWFLYALFLLHALSLLTWQRFGAAAFLLMCLALKPLNLLLPLPEVIRVAANQAPYYGLGVVLGTAGLAQAFVNRAEMTRFGFVPLAALLITVALGVAPALQPDVDFATGAANAIANIAWLQAVLPAAFAGTAMVIALASLTSGRLAAVLVFLGQRSMAIFILHVMAVAGTRILCLSLLGIREPLVVLGLSVAAGIGAPLIAYALVARMGLTKKLGLG